MLTTITDPRTLEVKAANFTYVKFGPKASDKPTDVIHTVSWSLLRFKASIDNPNTGERVIFRSLLKIAEFYAAHKMICRVHAKNLNGHASDLGGKTWAAVIEGMGGTPLEGFPKQAARKAVGSAFGQTGRKSLAEAEVKEAVEKLKAAGFEVNQN